jgi:glycosyltransferase involved in cell wall biosynthesis
VAVNLQTPINQLGYGIVGLNLALALERAGQQPVLWPLGAVEAPEQHHNALRAMIARQAEFSRLAPSLRIYHQFDLAQHVGKGPHCAYCFFELNRFKPRERNHLQQQDIVFAPSSWAGQVLIENGIPVSRVHYARPGVDPGVFSANHGQSWPRDTEGQPTIFLNVGKWEYRKGHDVLLDAFCKAFQPADNVLLRMHCHNPCLHDPETYQRYNNEWVSLYQNSRLGSKIQVSTERLGTQDDVARLMAMADCGVFPSRAEGWGLESAEMLAMGKHVILTDYSAHKDYANSINSLLISVPFLEYAHDGHWFLMNDPAWAGYPGQWARLGKDQVDQLVEHLRAIHRRKQAGELTVNAAGMLSMRQFTWDKTALSMTQVFS